MDPEDEIETPDEVETPDVSSYIAKIAELEAVIATHTDEIAAKDAEIQACKAANYDLMLQVPSGDTVAQVSEESDDETDVDIDDLFGE